MITTNIDLGQIILISLTGIIGFFIKRTLDDIIKRLDKQDIIIVELIKDVAALTAVVGMRKSDQLTRSGNERS